MAYMTSAALMCSDDRWLAAASGYSATDSVAQQTALPFRCEWLKHGMTTIASVRLLYEAT